MTTVGARPDERAEDLHDLARGSVLNLAGSVVAAVLNLALPVVITRSLAADDAGLFFQATAVFAIVLNLGTSGADTGVLRALPQARVVGRQHDLRRLLVVAVAPAVVASIGLVVALLALADPLSRAVTQGSGAAATFHGVLVAVLPWVPVAVAYAVVMSASRGLGSVLPLVLVEKVGRTSLETGAAGVAAVVSASVAVVVTAWVAPYAVMLVVIAVWVARRLRAQAPITDDAGPPTGWAELASSFWRFAAPRALSRVFTIALQRFDILVVGALRGPEDAAIYTAATRFLVLGLVLVQSIQQVMAPTVSERLALDDPRGAETVYRTTTAWLTLVSWPVYLLAMLYAPLLLDVFGPGYDAGAVAAAVLCATMLVATACGPVDSVLLMAGRSSLSLLDTGLALVVNVVLDLLLVPTLGVTGAALGWAAGILVKNLLALAQVHRLHGMHPGGPSTRCAMAVCVFGVGGAVAACRLLLGVDLGSFLVALLAGGATYVVLVRRHADRLDLEALVAVVRRRRSGRPRTPTTSVG